MITTLGSWASDDASVDDVERALSDLRRHEQRAAVRTGVLTLVCVVNEQAGADQALETVHELGARHPARTLIIVTEDADDRPARGMEAAVTVEVLEIDGRAVCHESVILRVRGAARYHLDSIIRPLTLADLPVFVWVPVHLPVLGDPILAVGDRLLVDTRAAADAETALPHVVKLMRQLPVTDLSWLRLAPWRDQLSGLFQGQVNRPFLAGVDHVTVAGHFAPRHLLAGWLIRRLGLPPGAVSLEDAIHVSIRLSARSEGQRGEFAVSRKDDERAIVTEVALPSGPSWTQTLRMRDRWPARALADAITRTGEDASFATALAGAVTLLS